MPLNGLFEFLVNQESAQWKLQFLGYVTQQYTAKRKQGVRRPVKAYDRIIKRIPGAIKAGLIDKFGRAAIINYELGQIPNLHSLIPLSQDAHVPIFALGASDGIVGAHFAKVQESQTIVESLVDNFLKILHAIL